VLPFSTYHGISFVDALFTATSAVCVTGLAVQDTGTCFTLFGQSVILILIQIGGLGLLTFSTFFIGLFRGHLGFKERYWLEESLTQQYMANFQHFLRRVLIFVFSIEILGTLLLWAVFALEYPWRQSLWLALFHSISAFCNAGFSLFSNSLEKYQGAFGINFIVMFLIVAGGIGFVVIEDIQNFFKQGKKAISFHSKIAVLTSLALTLGGFVVIYLLENHRSLDKSPLYEKILVSLFQSVTCRTAGFNTIPLTHLTEATLFLMMMLMFIGGSPGSTAGGIKTTSFAVFLSLLLCRLQGRDRPEFFYKTVSKSSVGRILTLILFSLVILALCTFLLLVTERDTQQHRSFLTILFETVSAFGTVGLSLGITPLLTSWGKMIIVFLMFIGRIGPLTLAVLMVETKEKLKYEYPEEEIMVG
jgi:trk system potassium uptake protein TrkH